MEIIIILVVLIVVSVVVFTQMKGSKPQIVSVLEHDTVSKQKKSPRKQETKKNVEKWDEYVPDKNASPTSRSERRKMFDPVASGTKVVHQQAKKELKQRKPTEEESEKAATEARKAKANLSSAGFTVVDEKKKKVLKDDDEPAAPKAEKQLTENELILKRLKDIREGAYKNNDKDGFEKKKVGSTLNAVTISHEKVMQKITEHREELEAKKHQPTVCLFFFYT